ncbi:MAG TPA: ABC transporter permease [Candidatus Acetothermia bacterium]|nr:ABC transporter permease [Candidatus Acetothermia bacterium]
MLATATPVSNPIAVLRGWWEYRDLLYNLVSKDIKVRYQGAALGFAWSLMNPLVVTAMYLFIFTYVMPSNQPHFALYLVTGIVHWTLFSNLVTQAPELLTANAGLLQKIRFPRLLVPASNLLLNLVLWAMALVVFFSLFIPLGGHFKLVLLAYPAYLLLFIGFNFGLMLILSVLYVDFRDLKHLIEVVMQVLFWATPIIYDFKLIPAHLRLLFAASPLTEFTLIFQDLFWAGRLPSQHLTLAFIFWTLASLALGLTIFYRRSARLIERL